MRSFLRNTIIIVSILSTSTNEVLASSVKPTEIPAVNMETVSGLAGLDAKTLALASVTAKQMEQISRHLAVFIKRQRPKLFTYRALLSETIERYQNLKASAAENSFDPCMFVTDEALEKASLAVHKAEEKFRHHCRTASDEVDNFLTPNQYALVKNARSNYGIFAPYKWLCLEEESRKQLKRFQRVYEARLQLVKKYKHLGKNISLKDLENQIAGFLSIEQLSALENLKKKLAQTKSI